MKNKICLLAGLLVLVAVLCTGCWDKKEFNKISFADAIAIDRKGEEFIVTLQINVPKNMKDGGENAPLWIISGHGRTLVEAVDDIVLRSPREIYWGHLNVALIGGGVLADDVGKVVDFFARDNQFRKRNYILVTEGSAQKILEAKPALAQINNYYMSGLIEDQEKRIKNSTAAFNDVMIAMSTEGLDLFLPKLDLVKGQEIAQAEEGPSEEPPKADKETKGQDDQLLQLSGGALVKDKKILGWVDSDWTKGYYWVTGEIKKGAITIDSPLEGGGQYTFAVSKSRCKLSLASSDPLILKLKITADLDLSEYSNFDSQASRTNVLEGRRQMRALEQATNETIKNQVRQSIETAQALNCDPFGFGQWLGAYHPTIMANQDWANYSQDLSIEIEVETKLKMAMLIN